MLKVNLDEKFARFAERWSPKIAGEINDSYVKLVKFSGEFVWHHHDAEDELFLVLRGTMRMKYRDGGREVEELVGPGEFIVMPRGMEHCPASAGAEEVHVLLLEPKTTLNTGNVQNERTVAQLDRI
jgi:mannose-6-phosphate isomerase-like protein (cupin superfamily)